MNEKMQEGREGSQGRKPRNRGRNGRSKEERKEAKEGRKSRKSRMEGKSLKKTTHAHNLTEKKKRRIFRDSNKNRHAD